MKNIFLLTIFFCNLSFTSCKEPSTREEYVKSDIEKSNTIIEKKETPEVDYDIIEVARDLYVVWSMIFTDSNRMLLTERNGKLRVIENGRLLDKPLKVFEEVSSKGEEGLMGLTADPDYKNNKFVYLSYAYSDSESGDLKVKVVRFKDNGNNLSDEMIIIDELPAERYHAGCRLKFGPDGKLYITTGDAGKGNSLRM